jgi:diketogulonate reductase-like aldo/keto reductase
MQVVLKWTIQNGVAVVPRSGSKEHIIENLQLFDFTLDDADMEAIDSMNENYPCDKSRIIAIHACRNVACVDIYRNLLV